MDDWAADVASRVMAECVAKNGGENVAFYLAQALRDERERCIEQIKLHGADQYGLVDAIRSPTETGERQ